MKRSFLRERSLFFAVIAVAFALLSCSKEKPAPTPAAVPAGNFQATIGNRAWTSTLSYAVIQQGRLVIYGQTKDGRQLQFNLSDVTTGTYPVNQDKDNRVSYTDTAESYDEKVAAGYNGQIVLTQSDLQKKLVSGTFHLVLSETTSKHLLSVEDGVFSNLPIIQGAFEAVTLVGQYRENAQGPGMLATISIDALGKVSFTKKADVPYYLQIANNYSAYNRANDSYLFSSLEGRSMLIYKDGVANVLSRSDSMLSAPVHIGTKDYGYFVTYSSTPVYTIYELDPLTGKPRQALASEGTGNENVAWEKGSSATDGANLFLASGMQFMRLNLATNALSEFPANTANLNTPCFLGLESPSANKILFMRSAQGAATADLCLTDLSLASPQQTVLHTFDLNIDVNTKFASVYNPSNKTYYFIYPDADFVTGEAQTQIFYYNTANGNSGTTTCSGYIFGVETLE